MYSIDLRYYGCKYDIQRDLSPYVETLAEAIAIVSDVMAENNSTAKAQRAPVGNWLSCVMINNSIGCMVAAIEQEPGRPRRIITDD